MNRWFGLVLCTLSVLLWTPVVRADGRLYLVVGNSSYRYLYCFGP